MIRDITNSLKAWKNGANRKPLVLQGARQVGKTTVLQQFGKDCFSRVISLNFERDKSLANLFEDTLDPKSIISRLSIYKDEVIEPKNTLLIFDEIQECPRALNSLKYFCEEAPHYFGAG